MKLSDVEFNSIEPVNNYVLLRQIMDTSQIRLGEGKIFIDTTYRPEFHQSVYCEVVKLPKSLVYSRKRSVENSMDWKTKIELKIGDRVIANYLTVLKANVIENNGNKYIIIPYQFIYCSINRWDYKKDGYKVILDEALWIGVKNIDIEKIIDGWIKNGVLIYHKRDQDFPVTITDSKDKKIPLPNDVLVSEKQRGKFAEMEFFKIKMINGFVIFEDVMEEPKSDIIWTPADKKERVGLVRYIGRPNVEYRDTYYFDDDYITTGQIIHTHFKFYKTLENELHSIVGKKFYVAQRRFILGVLG